MAAIGLETNPAAQARAAAQASEQAEAERRDTRDHAGEDWTNRNSGWHRQQYWRDPGWGAGWDR